MSFRCSLIFNWANTHFNHHLNIFVRTLFKEIGTTKIVNPLKQIHSFNLYNRNAIPNRWELSKHNRKLSKAALSFRLVSYATGRKKYLILSCQMILKILISLKLFLCKNSIWVRKRWNLSKNWQQSMVEKVLPTIGVIKCCKVLQFYCNHYFIQWN